MIEGRDSQAEPCFRAPLHKRRHEARANADLLTRLIRDELCALPLLGGQRSGARRAWILAAQARRRQWLATARRYDLLLREQESIDRLLRPLAAE
ncbi:MAG: hypothetical protein ACF8R7_17745 [Phycisphaerales bacterium JB039]